MEADGTRETHLKRASMALAGALVQDDILAAAAMLRCAAKHLEGAAGAEGGEPLGARSRAPNQDGGTGRTIWERG